MVKVSNTYCDIHDCKEIATHEDMRLPVVFTTEQTEGRHTDNPYIEMKELDLCETHYDDFIFNSPLTGVGAQGNNTYRLDVKLNRESYRGKDEA